MILNNYGFPASKKDKRVRVVKFGKITCKPVLSTQKKPVYENYGNAVNRRRKAILELAHQLAYKPWYYFIFN
jgi:hypothetical protein